MARDVRLRALCVLMSVIFFFQLKDSRVTAAQSELSCVLHVNGKTIGLRVEAMLGCAALRDFPMSNKTY